MDDSHHCGHLSEKAPSLANFVGEAYIELSPSVAGEYKLADGDPVRVESESGKLILPVKISNWIKDDTVKIPRNFYATRVTSLLRRKIRVDRVKISKVDE
jgi:predicted molibdopterin-dependent oxidoreductase YjgC